MKKEILKFLEPMPVMFYLFFIGLWIGVEKPVGLILTFLGGFLGMILLLEELKIR